jgi:hypothetical protein
MAVGDGGERDSALRRAPVTRSYLPDNLAIVRRWAAVGKNRLCTPIGVGVMTYGFVPEGRSVFVRSYTRVRFGNLENVCAHWRSAPGQLCFTFD